MVKTRIATSPSLPLESRPGRPISLRWRHNGRDGVWNHQPHNCLLNSLFGCRSKKTSKFRVTGLCAGNSPGTGEFPAQMSSNAKNVYIWWRHHDATHPYPPHGCSPIKIMMFSVCDTSRPSHYCEAIMDTVASQITSLAIVYSTVYLDADQSKHQSSASLAFVWGIHRGPVNSPHKWPVTRKMFPFDDVIMV